MANGWTEERRARQTNAIRHRRFQREAAQVLRQPTPRIAAGDLEAQAEIRRRILAGNVELARASVRSDGLPPNNRLVARSPDAQNALAGATGAGNRSRTRLHEFRRSWLFTGTLRKGVKMPEYRMKVSPDTVAYSDAENRKLVVEFAIPGAPADTVDVKILKDSVHMTAPARDVEYVASLALAWPVKPDKAEATYQHGLLRIEVPFKDPMEDAVKVAIKEGGAEAKTKRIKA